MRLISFALTTRQVRERTKSVTRRMGWKHLKPGDRLEVCEKVMGRRKGEPLVKLCVIEVVAVDRERLLRMIMEPAYGHAEVVAEGFPDMTPEQFVDFFCASHEDCTPASIITRIQFRYV